MLLTRYGLREWLWITVICVAFALGAIAMKLWIGLAIVALVWLALVAFFRDPLGRRPASDDPADFVSPADGVVSKVLSVEHHDAVDGPAVVVRIFLSVLDVHLNRAPCESVALGTTYRPGEWLDARNPEGAKRNESMLLHLERTDGVRVGVRQISGAIARRIVCPVKKGDRFERAERYGMIKFGSTTELIVAGTRDDVAVHVGEGVRVHGGVTILATKAIATTP